MSDEHFMKLALEEARKALSDGDLPVGAVVVLDNKVVGRGRRTGKGAWKLDHAEIKAVKKAITTYPNEARNMTIYTTLEPCVMCYGTILNCRIPKVVYAFPDAYGGATSIPIKKLPIRHHNEEVVIVKDVCKNEAHTLFHTFCTTSSEKFWRDETNPFVKQVFTSLTSQEVA